MASFDKYAPRLKKWEGAFGDHPADTGGATMYGVTLTTFRMFFGEDKTVADLKAMTEAQWRQIMKGYFWDKCWGDMIVSQPVAEIIVDWCINSGMGMLRKIQAIVGTKQDGIMGPKTLAAINAAKPKLLHFYIKAAHAAYFEQLVRNRASNIAFYDGWLNRLADFQCKEK